MEYQQYRKLMIVITVLFCLAAIVYHVMKTPAMRTDSKNSVAVQAVATVPMKSGTVKQDLDASFTRVWNLNTVTAAQLRSISGIGKQTAQNIVDYRDKIGQFAQLEELLEVDGVGKKTFEKLKTRLYIA